MKNLSIKMSSVTYALKAKKILSEHGIQAVVQKNPHPKKNEGCGYLLFISNTKTDVVEILRQAHIPFQEVLWTE